MQWGYNTNGFAFHPLSTAIEILAEEGYTSVALTLDCHHLNPFGVDFARELEQTRQQLQALQMTCVIETGARFLLDPRHKHQPTLLTADTAERRRRLDFYRRCLEIAAALDATSISLWSGSLRSGSPGSEAPSAEDPFAEEILWQRLSDGLTELCHEAERFQQRIAFEPEPGMFIDTMARWDELRRRCPHPALGLTLDLGHVQCLETDSLPTIIHRYADQIWNIHIEDMCRGVHDHLRFGDGEIDFLPVLRALQDIHYTGPVNVELSRHAHMAPQVARESYQFLVQTVAAASS